MISLKRSKTSALDKKIIEPAEVVEAEASEDDELEEEPSGEAEIVVLSVEDKVDDVSFPSSDPPSTPF
ncbi:hypothetical protein ACTXT7_017029 [Hymenolepis weldensis]